MYLELMEFLYNVMEELSKSAEYLVKENQQDLELSMKMERKLQVLI